MKRNCRFKTNSLFAAAVLVLTTLTSVQLAAAPVSARQLPRLMPSPEAALHRADEIALTAEQRARLEGDLRDLNGEVGSLSEQVRRESDALAQLLAANKPDDAAVAAQFEKVLAAEDAVKRVRLKMSLRTRAVLTAEQQTRLASLQGGGARGKTIPPEQQELAARMQRVKELIERAKSEGRDLSAMRAMWKRVDQLTREGNTSEASRVLDETAQALESSLSAPPARK